MKVSILLVGAAATFPSAFAHPMLRHSRRHSPAAVERRAAFTLSNGQQAQQENAKFASLTANSQCNEGEQACVGDGFAQCSGGKFQVQACSGGTKCFSLPLVNKAGTSISCDTEADATARIAATGATGGLTGNGAAGGGSASTGGAASAGADGAASGSTATSTGTGADTGASASQSTQAAATTGGQDDCTEDGIDAAGQAAQGGTSAGTGAAATTAANAATSTSAAANGAAGGDFKLANGQEAQKLNAKFATLAAGATCNDGESGCVQGQFAQCVSGKFQAGSSCAGGTKCFALPLVNKPGTSVTCDTEADALARIQATGATGGLTG